MNKKCIMVHFNKILLTTLLITSLLSTYHINVYADTSPTTYIVTEGKNQKIIGDIIISNDAENIYFSFQLTPEYISEGWEIKTIHLAVSESLSGIPVNTVVIFNEFILKRCCPNIPGSFCII